MKKTYAAFVVLLVVTISGCFTFGGAEGFTVETKEGVDPPFEAKTAFVDVRTDLTEAHFAIGNYDFKMVPKTINSIDPLTSADQVRVTFGLKGEKGDDVQNPVQPGEYSGSRLKWVDIYHFKSGKELITNLKERKGSVTIASISGDEIKGSIDVTGEGGKVVKGSFTAKRVR